MFEISSSSRNMNFKSTGDGLPPDGSGGGRTPVNFPLFREPSIYSLTFGEFQNSIGGNLGKDFGSMNMDEFLKNIWTAEETQAMASSTFGGADLQRQGSLTLPRTLSQKTVDEVWRDLFNENSTTKDWNSNGGSSTLQQRQQTLGEMTLEEFLARAGVVRDDTQQSACRTNGVVDNRILESNNPIPGQSPNLAINLNGIRSSQQPQQQQQQLLLPRPTTVAYATPVHLANNGQLASHGIRGTIMGIGDSRMNNGLVQGGGMGLIGLGAGAVATGSPANQISSDAFGKSNGDKSSLSPVPYIFTGGPRGRRSGAVEKVVERRQRRMIKNRESAARSRARKQAYTMELEAEVAKLKEENEELQKKQAKVMEIQKIQVLEMMNQQQGAKKRSLRRTQTDPW